MKLSRTRIVLPARCKKCPHLQCFDLYNYLQMNEKRPTWRCPVCSDWAPYKLLIIDANAWKNLTRAFLAHIVVKFD
ncbi:MIZ/SP-RING zinc finger, partial [Trichostrongylus colubriformis]